MILSGNGMNRGSPIPWNKKLKELQAILGNILLTSIARCYFYRERKSIIFRGIIKGFQTLSNLSVPINQMVFLYFSKIYTFHQVINIIISSCIMI